MMMLKATISAVWLVLLLDSLPGISLLGADDRMRRLLLGAAIVGSVAAVVHHLQRPSDEVFNEGREHERRIMLREMNECRVIPFDRTGA